MNTNAGETSHDSVADPARGAAIYTRWFLPLYDVWVHGFSNALAWKCPTVSLIEHCNRCLSGSHLDVGVGTGYFLDKCKFPTDRPEVALLDLNPIALNFTRDRIRRYSPTIHQGNVLEAVDLGARTFQSIGLMYLLHCIPGNLRSKAAVFDSLSPYLAPGGVIFGATILGRGVPHNRLARTLISAYNQRGIFGNSEDSLDDLRTSLDERFSNVSVHVNGCVALFEARNRR